MPSPFPGMDPYLEGPEWSSIHAELSSEIARQLAPKVRPKYIVRTMQRFLSEDYGGIGIANGEMYPDVGLAAKEQRAEYDIDVIDTAPPFEMTVAIAPRAPEFTVEIRTVANRRLVTSIEVLSPTNKRGAGFPEYLEKRERVLHSPAHLIEIDLLRAGKRLPTVEALPDAPYFVFLSRAGRRPKIQVWAISLRQPLPEIPVPLLVRDADTTLNLQVALTTIYDALGYDLSIGYARPPDPPLKDEDAAWTGALLQKADGVES